MTDVFFLSLSLRRSKPLILLIHPVSSTTFGGSTFFPINDHLFSEYPFPFSPLSLPLPTRLTGASVRVFETLASTTLTINGPLLFNSSYELRPFFFLTPFPLVISRFSYLTIRPLPTVLILYLDALHRMAISLPTCVCLPLLSLHWMRGFSEVIGPC